MRVMGRLNECMVRLLSLKFKKFVTSGRFRSYRLEVESHHDGKWGVHGESGRGDVHVPG